MIGRSIALVLGFGITSILAPIARFAGSKAGLVDRPEGAEALKIHRHEVPIVGGVIVVAGTLLALVALLRPPAGWLVLGVVLALLIGLVDDLRPLPVPPRLLLLGLTGVVLAPSLRFTSWDPVVAVGMAALVVAIANAVNILDGQDGLAGGLTAVAALAMASMLPTSHPGSWLGLSLAGSALAFLIWNRPPARMFLGNNGAYALGALLAVLAASLVTVHGWSGLVAAGACLIVFAFELVSTLLRRWRLGRSLTGGDRTHSYDRLARRLRSRGGSTLVFIAFGSLGWVLAAVLLYASVAIGILVLAATLAIALVVSTKMWSPRSVP